jgi:hypothetical protein
LARLVAEYPDNEFLLARLADELTDANCVDPRAAPALAGRLIALSPDNTHYRYLKARVFLSARWAPGRKSEALEQLPSGNHLPDFYLPYRKYEDRVNALRDRADADLLEARYVPGMYHGPPHACASAA